MNYHDPTPTDEMLEKKFKVLIRGLKAVGTCPLRYSEKKNKFELVWLSSSCLLTLFFALWYISIWVIHLAESVVVTNTTTSGGSSSSWVQPFTAAVKNDENLSSTAVNTVLIFVGIRQALLPLSHMYQIISGWIKCHELAHFINNWQTFQQNFARQFPNQVEKYSHASESHTSPSKSVGNFWRKLLAKHNLTLSDIFLCTYISLPIVVGMWMTFGVNASAKHCAHFVDLSSLIRINYIMGLIVAEGFEDAKNMLMFFTIADAFKMIRHGIDSKTVRKRKGEKIDGKSVRDWRELIVFVRAQCELGCKNQKPSQLFFFAQCILQLTICSFLVLVVSWKNPGTFQVVIHYGTLSGLCFCRLCFQAYVAELPGAEERNLANTLALLKTDNDPATLVQINLTHQLISNDPTSIHFGNYVVLNKRLLLVIANQVVTYLIVILQFTQK